MFVYPSHRWLYPISVWAPGALIRGHYSVYYLTLQKPQTIVLSRQPRTCRAWNLIIPALNVAKWDTANMLVSLTVSETRIQVVVVYGYLLCFLSK